SRNRRHLDGAAKLLASLSYHGVLQRGFALVRDAEGRSVRSAAQVAMGDQIDIELADGHVGAHVSKTGGKQPGSREEVRGAAPVRTRPSRNGGSQGSLF